MSGIMDEQTMKDTLGKYVPSGETLLAGIHCINKELHTSSYFRNCLPLGDYIVLVESDEENVLEVKKSKVASSDMYIGITENHCIVTGCEGVRFLYEYQNYEGDKSNIDIIDLEKDESVGKEMGTEKILGRMLQADIGHVFKLSDIVSAETKNKLFGAILLSFKFKSGCEFILTLPKKAGVGNGMPNHLEYRDMIIKCITEATNK